MATTTAIACRNWVGRLGALSLVFSLVTIPLADAQGREWSRRTPEEMVEEHVTRMTEELELTDEQVTQVRPIIEEHVGKMRAPREKHRQQGRHVRNSGREEMENLQKEMEQRLEPVLTAEQTQKYREMQQQRRGRRRERTGRRGGGPQW